MAADFFIMIADMLSIPATLSTGRLCIALMTSAAETGKKEKPESLTCLSDKTVSFFGDANLAATL